MHDELASRLRTVPGVGPLTALRFIATIDQVDRFQNASALTCYLGLVPREHSSGEHQRRGSITKAGSPAMRFLLTQATWSALRSRQPDPMVEWARRVAKRRGKGTAVVALSRKIARVLFAVWRDGSTYQAPRAAAAAPRNQTAPPRPRLQTVPLIDESS